MSEITRAETEALWQADLEAFHAYEAALDRWREAHAAYKAALGAGVALREDRPGWPYWLVWAAVGLALGIVAWNVAQ